MTQTPAVRQAGFLQGICLLLPVTLSVMGALLVAPVIPQIAQDFSHVPGIAYLAPLVVTTPGLCIALFAPFAGVLGDRFGRRKLLIVSMVVYSIFGIAPFFLRDLGAILVTRVVVGIMEAIVMVMSTTLIADLFEAKVRNRWLAAQTGLASVSAVIFLLIGGFAGRVGWHGPFLVYLMPLLLVGGVILFTWEPARPVEASDRRPGSWAGFPWAFMAWVCLVSLFAATMFYTVQIQLSTGLTELGLTDPAQIGFLTAMASLAVPLGTVAFWLLSPRLGLRSLLLVEFLLLGIGFVWMSHAQNASTFVLAAALNQIGSGMILPTLLTWATGRLSFDVRARGMGFWQSTFALGAPVCGALVPLLAGYAGGVLGAFQILGVAALAAVALLVVALIVKGRGATPAAGEA